MKKYLIIFVKNIFLQIISLAFIVGLIAFAAISWPSETPEGGVPGGKFMTYFNNMFNSDCPTGSVLKGFTSTGVIVCNMVSWNNVSDKPVPITTYADVMNQHVRTTDDAKFGTVTVSDIKTAGNRCSTASTGTPTATDTALNGRMARDSDGLILSCQDGKWKNAQGLFGTLKQLLNAPDGFPDYINCGNVGIENKIITPLYSYRASPVGWWYSSNGVNHGVIYKDTTSVPTWISACPNFAGRTITQGCTLGYCSN